MTCGDEHCEIRRQYCMLREQKNYNCFVHSKYSNPPLCDLSVKWKMESMYIFVHTSSLWMTWKSTPFKVKLKVDSFTEFKVSIPFMRGMFKNVDFPNKEIRHFHLFNQKSTDTKIIIDLHEVYSVNYIYSYYTT